MGKGEAKGQGGCAGKPVAESAAAATTGAGGDDPKKYGPYNVGNKKFTLSLAAKITANKNALGWFEHGLAWMYGYNHEEAISCFTKAAEADADCAMAWWAIAYSVSSSYNWSPGLGCGYDHIQKAVALKDKCNDLEKDLIDALATRSTKEARDAADPTKLSFGNPPELNVKFGEAMEALSKKYPEDLDVQAIYVEAIMNIKPWALWDKKLVDGAFEITPADDNTLKAKAALEAAFKLPNGDKHPPLLHLYCHMMELSPNPELALPYADNLRKAMPSMGHLVHMPSHIDAWVGGYLEGIKANEEGTAADDKYVTNSGNESQFYKFYRMHNQQFVVWMSMNYAQYANSMKYARKMQTQLSSEQCSFMLAGIIPMGAVFLEAYRAVAWHVMIRFGKWDDILAEPMDTDGDVFPTCIATGHYARGIAYASKGDVVNARAEQVKFRAALKDGGGVPLSARVLHNNPAPSILAIGEDMLEGEILYREAVFDGKDAAGPEFDAAFAKLQSAVDSSMNLKYQEPWAWMVPVRHALGALQLEQGRVEAAEKTFREDNSLWKDNVWSLLGLTQCHAAMETKPADAADIAARFKKASKHADIKLTATCFCAKEAGAICVKPE